MAKFTQCRDRYAQMLGNSATAALCVDSDNVIVSWNGAAEQLFGHSAEAAIGSSLSMIIPSVHRAGHEAGFARAVKSGQTHLGGHSIDIRALHANGHEIPVDLSMSVWFENGKPMFGGLLRDITDRKTAQERLEYLAHCDPLTSLPNRNAMQAHMTTEIEKRPCSLLLLDLDGFKDVNDSLGHSVGDQLLAAVALRLLDAVAGSGFVARLGGDEFAILLEDNVSPLQVDDITDRIFRSLHLPFELVGQSIFVSTSIGIAMAPRDASSVDELLSNADLALYCAKNDGGGKRTFFTRTMQNRSEQKRRLGADLRRALLNDEFELWYQPQFSLPDFQLTGVEALLRWRHPSHGILLPNTFIEVLDECAIAEAVGDWVLDQTCAQVALWEKAGQSSLRIGVNLFPAQLRTGRLFDVVSSTLTRHGVCPSQIEIEITENTVLRADEQSLKELKKLRALGVGIAFDDFGTGFASLSLLQKYPATRLKIDRSFVARIDREAGDAAIVTAVIAMAKSLGLAAIAEGVETSNQEKALMRLGCDEVQGFRYGRAMPALEFAEKWQDWSSNASPAYMRH